MSEKMTVEEINNELSSRVMPDIEYIALLNTKVDLLQVESARRRELLRASKDWLESYLEYLDNDIPFNNEPNNSVAKLIGELGKELADG